MAHRRSEPAAPFMTPAPPATRQPDESPEHALLVKEVSERIEVLGFGTVKRLSEMTDLDDPRPSFSTLDMRTAIRQAELLLSRFYVHLAGKRTLYSSDPLMALRILDNEVTDGSLNDDREFHDRMSAIFANLHDRHTFYHLPRPYRSTIAFLPFLVEAVRGGREYVVTKIAGTAFEGTEFRASLEHPVVVTHWNGVPMATAVARSGERSSGANRAARMARGLDRLTQAWLGATTGPDENSVSVTYTVGEQVFTRRFDWLAVRQPQEERAVYACESTNSMAFAGDPEGEWLRDVKEKLFHDPAPDPAVECLEDGIALYRRYSSKAGKEYGYLRIYTFVVDPERREPFLSRIRAILRNAPPTGLIIDIRGNPGGDAIVAEDFLELFSLRRVAREGLQFANTTEALKLAALHYKRQGGTGSRDMNDFQAQARATGAPFASSPAFAPARAAWAPTAADVYHGPVVVIIDANCFSSSELFAAGMQDHDLADIIGTDRQTGGGGGNVWAHEDLCELWRDDPESPLEALAEGASFAIAIRRTTRVGTRAGLALEDMGVLAKKTVELTRTDVLGHNEDLLEAAAARVDERARMAPPTAVGATYDDDGGVFTLSSSGIDRIDVYINGEALVSVAEPNGKKVRLHAPLVPPKTARFLGYRAGHVESVEPFEWPSEAPDPGAPEQDR